MTRQRIAFHGVAPGATGIVASTVDAGGGMPGIERVLHETGRSGPYRHRVLGRVDRLVAVQVTLSGCGEVHRMDAAPLPVPRGRCLLFRFGDDLAYAAAPGAPWEFVYANLHGEAALAMAGDLVAAHGHMLPVDLDDPAVRRVLDLARGPGVRHVRLPVADSARLAADLLIALASGASERQDAGRDLLDDACAHLVRHLGEAVDVAAVAAAVGVGREHLSRLFRRRLGLPPAAWLRRERLRQAELLLRAGRLPVAEVARRCGFATASHFVHAFRQATGVTPGRWRG